MFCMRDKISLEWFGSGYSDTDILWVVKYIILCVWLLFWYRYLSLQIVGMCVSGWLLFSDDKLISLWILVISWAAMNSTFSDAMAEKSRSRAVYYFLHYAQRSLQLYWACSLKFCFVCFVCFYTHVRVAQWWLLELLSPVLSLLCVAYRPWRKWAIWLCQAYSGSSHCQRVLSPCTIFQSCVL